MSKKRLLKLYICVFAFGAVLYGLIEHFTVRWGIDPYGYISAVMVNGVGSHVAHHWNIVLFAFILDLLLAMYVWIIPDFDRSLTLQQPTGRFVLNDVTFSVFLCFGFLNGIQSGSELHRVDLLLCNYMVTLLVVILMWLAILLRIFFKILQRVFSFDATPSLRILSFPVMVITGFSIGGMLSAVYDMSSQISFTIIISAVFACMMVYLGKPVFVREKKPVTK